jgi:hypothetical protein
MATSSFAHQLLRACDGSPSLGLDVETWLEATRTSSKLAQCSGPMPRHNYKLDMLLPNIHFLVLDPRLKQEHGLALFSTNARPGLVIIAQPCHLPSWEYRVRDGPEGHLGV